MCGMGVTSRMKATRNPTALMARMADSRPEPGPFTRMPTVRMPQSMALRAAVSAAFCAAKGVFLREPLNPEAPELAQLITFPVGSVNVMIVLLNVLFT